MKYELTNEIKKIYGRKFHRIKALQDFGFVKAGDLGGWVMRNFWRGWGLMMAIAEVFNKRLEAKAQRRAMIERMDRGLFFS